MVAVASAAVGSLPGQPHEWSCGGRATPAVAALQGQPSVAAGCGTIFRRGSTTRRRFGDRICASGVWWGVWERLAGTDLGWCVACLAC